MCADSCNLEVWSLVMVAVLGEAAEDVDEVLGPHLGLGEDARVARLEVTRDLLGARDVLDDVAL